MRLNDVIKFQKALALAASASNSFEAEAAELAARRLLATCNLNPTRIPNVSLYSHLDFADSMLLRKLRDEWLVLHPIVVKEEKPGEPRRLDSLSIPFSIKGFRKTANKNRKHGSVNEPRDEARIEKLRMLLNSGKARTLICAEDGFKQGEISGIIRDYTGAKSANRQYRENPRWVVENIDGRNLFQIRSSAEAGEEYENRYDAANPQIVDGVSVEQSYEDAEPDSQCGET